MRSAVLTTGVGNACGDGAVHGQQNLPILLSYVAFPAPHPKPDDIKAVAKGLDDASNIVHKATRLHESVERDGHARSAFSRDLHLAFNMLPAGPSSMPHQCVALLVTEFCFHVHGRCLIFSFFAIGCSPCIVS